MPRNKKNRKNTKANVPMNKQNARASQPRKNQNRKRNNRDRMGGLNMMSRQLAPASIGTSIRQLGSNLDGLLFHHSELVYQLYATTGYSTATITINPALPSAFPWLSRLAPLFETYEVVDFAIKYVPACSTTTPGFVMIGFDYDSYDSVPLNMSDFMLTADSCSASAWQTCEVRLTSAALKRRGVLYTRTGAVASSDLKTYDLGKVLLATQGNGSDDTLIGNIFISYRLRFFTPQPYSPYEAYYYANPAQDCTAAHPFGNSQLTIDNLQLASAPPVRLIYIASSNINRILSQRSGTYVVWITFKGTGLNTDTTDITINDTTNYPTDSYSSIFNFVNGAATQSFYYFETALSDGNSLNIALSAATTVTQFAFLAFAAEDGLAYTSAGLP